MVHELMIAGELMTLQAHKEKNVNRVAVDSLVAPTLESKRRLCSRQTDMDAHTEQSVMMCWTISWGRRPGAAIVAAGIMEDGLSQVA